MGGGRGVNLKLTVKTIPKRHKVRVVMIPYSVLHGDGGEDAERSRQVETAHLLLLPGATGILNIHRKRLVLWALDPEHRDSLVL